MGGMGKRSLTRFAAYLASYSVFEISVAKGYGHAEFREDLKKLLRRTGAQGIPTVFLFNDQQIVQDSFLEDIHFLLNKWEIPYLYAPEELEPILQVINCIISYSNSIRRLVLQLQTKASLVLTQKQRLNNTFTKMLIKIFTLFSA
jgi:dynein heavy chain